MRPPIVRRRSASSNPEAPVASRRRSVRTSASWRRPRSARRKAEPTPATIQTRRSPTPPIGACCVQLTSQMTTCIEVTQAQCAMAQGQYYGAGSACSDEQVPCDMPAQGACCIPSAIPEGMCVITSRPMCKASGGTYHGDGTACDNMTCFPPVTGACCLAQGGLLTCIDLTADDCNAHGGEYAGDGTSCNSANACGA